MTEKQAHPWIFLRGLGREAAHWGTFPENFQRQFPGQKVYIYEPPGVGKRFNETAAFGMPACIEDLNQSLLHDIKSRYGSFSLLGFSFGGMIAAQAAFENQNQLRNLVLINTSSRCLLPFYKRLLLDSVLKNIHFFIGNNLFRRERGILNITSNYPAVRSLTYPIWCDIQRLRPSSNRTFYMHLLTAAQWEHPFTDIPPFRTLILNSQKDRVAHYKNSIYLSKILNGKLCVHPTAGHDLYLDEPDWMETEIKKWLHGFK